ncbi:hypothetical protein [Burkholderia stabilis]|uniref:hypothetical protein n=2 Tax=Burkholderia stabilis TaxID=95485 RepID=UPI001F4A4516|nr:hypothetical protein [Burkholderia stabilis]
MMSFRNCAVTRRTRRIPVLRLPARLASRCRSALFTAIHSVRFVMNCHSSLASLVILSAGFACAAGAQSLPADSADAPVFASSPSLAPPRRQRSAQIPPASAAVATAASDVSASALARPGSLVAAEPDSRSHRTLRRPLVPSRPHRASAASAAADGWSSDTLYASPYATSPYVQPNDPD